MKRLILLFGMAIGYVAGSAAGRERYEQIRSMSMKVKNNPQVQAGAAKAADAAKDAAPVVKEKAANATGESSGTTGSTTTGSTTTGSTTSGPTLEDSAYPKA